VNQLTYPIERWPVPYRLQHPEQRNSFFHTMWEKGSLTAACEALGMARGSVYRHATLNPDFKSELDAACDYLYQCLRDDAIRIADEGYSTIDGDHVKASLLRTKVDARLRVAGMHRPANVNVNVDNRQVNVTTTDAERARLIEVRRRALEDKKQESVNTNNERT